MDNDPAGLESAVERIRLRLAERPSSASNSNNLEAPIVADLIPGYELVREIHRGGQGRVYEALQKATHRRVAVKVMREGPLAGDRERARFEREIQILAQLRHPHIVAIHDSGQLAGLFYFVMDYIPGRRLDEHLENVEKSKNRNVETKELLQLFAKVCEAVNAAHVRGVIHRDLKPANIRVDESSEPHVLDFGLAKLVTNELGIDEPSGPMTVTGQFHGSLPWASPEQAEGSPGKIDTRTDVYSLGIILYQLLTGTFPYDVTGNMRDVLDRIMKAEPRRPRSGTLLINDEIETIVLKCLNKDRGRRYQTAGALARDIRHYLAGEAIEAKRDSSLYVLRKQLRRHRAGVAVAAMLWVVVMAALGVSVASWRRAVAGETEARQRAAEADRRYAIAREGADLLLFGICTELPKLAGSGEMQKGLVEKARKHYERLAAERPDDPDERRGIWESLATLGGSFVTLGDSESARQTYEEAARMVQEALTIRPKSIQFQCDLSNYCEALGWITMNRGDVDRAEPYFAEQLDIATRLVDAEPKRSDFQFMVAQCYLALGNLNLWKHKTEEAGKHFRKSLAITERLARAEPDHREYLCALSKLNSDLGAIAWMADDMKHTEAYHAEQVRVAERLVETEPNNPEYLVELADGLETLGQVAFRTGDPAKAEEYYRKALALHERLVAAEPKNPFYQTILAKNYGCLGEFKGRAKNFDEALPYFQKASAIYEPLVAGQPDNPAYRELIMPVYDWLAYAWYNKGRTAEAQDYAERRTATLRRLAERPAVAAQSLRGYAETLLSANKPPSLRDPTTALGFAKKAVELSKGKDPKSLNTLALAYDETGDALSAIATQGQALALLPPGDSAQRDEMQANLNRFRGEGCAP
jgi:non-specific serine/threonine protein kinase/serine/threonine-protein kinase